MMTTNVNNRCNLLLIDSLVEIRLIRCRKCELIPTFGELPSLRFLALKGMYNLKRIGAEFYSTNSSNNTGGASSSSIGGETISKRITLFPKLEKFTLKNMNNLEEWTEASTTATTEEGAMVAFPCLEELSIASCEALRIVPTHFPFLKKLSLTRIKSGVPIANICNGLMTTLTSLYIEGVSELISLPKELLQNNRNLTSLHIQNLVSLQDLVLGNLPITLQNLVPLQELKIWSCPKLSSFPNIQGLTSLCKLSINSCDGISNLPIGLGSCTSLEKLGVYNCPNLICVGEDDIRELKSLSYLVITSCGKLKGVTGFKYLHCLTRLEDLQLGGFSEELESFPFNQQQQQQIQQLHHLKTLRLEGWPKLKSLPHQLQHLTALRVLWIYEFDGLEALPDWFGNLSSLEKLSIWACKNLKYLPSVESMRRLTNLRDLSIYGCPVLEERCTKHNGPEWSKISHIRRIDTNI